MVRVRLGDGLGLGLKFGEFGELKFGELKRNPVHRAVKIEFLFAGHKINECVVMCCAKMRPFLTSSRQEAQLPQCMRS